MVPGMQHCSGGPGASAFDMVTELEAWVEKGVAPERVIASRSSSGAVDRTRPLCVYPKAAVYTGAGSTDDAANFECRAPGAGASR
jgi:tannase/feruloyl esterase